MEEETKNHFPLLVRYKRDKKDTLVKTPKDLKSNVPFYPLKVNVGSEDEKDLGITEEALNRVSELTGL